MNNEAAVQLLAVLEKTISAGKYSVKPLFKYVWPPSLKKPFFPDQNELTAAQQFLEHAAQTNLVRKLQIIFCIKTNLC